MSLQALSAVIEKCNAIDQEAPNLSLHCIQHDIDKGKKDILSGASITIIIITTSIPNNHHQPGQVVWRRGSSMRRNTQSKQKTQVASESAVLIFFRIYHKMQLLLLKLKLKIQNIKNANGNNYDEQNFPKKPVWRHSPLVGRFSDIWRGECQMVRRTYDNLR